MPDPKPSAAVLSYLRSATHFVGVLAKRIALELEVASTAAGCGWRHVVGPGHHPTITRGRQAAARALRALDLGEGKRLSLSEIGLILGGKDHSTVVYYLEGGKKKVTPAAAAGI